MIKPELRFDMTDPSPEQAIRASKSTDLGFLRPYM